MRKNRITIRVTDNQFMVLKEIAEALDTGYSLLVRTIIGDWITKNEEYIDKIIDKHKRDAHDRDMEENSEL